MSMPAAEFAIIAVGMNTAVGWDTASSCASFRAGISRTEELDYAEVFDDQQAEIVPIAGNIVPGRPAECEGLGKMVALGVDALKDLLAHGAVSTRPQPATRVFLALPNYSLRQESFLDVNDAIAAGRADEVASDENQDDETRVTLQFALECNRHLVSRLFRAAGTPLRIDQTSILYGHHATLLVCLQQAMRVLRAGEAERCIVGAIDSLAESDTLEWALLSGRLKMAGAPCGFSPGEAAIFLELVRADSVPDDSSVSAYLSEPVVVADDSDSPNSSSPGLSLAKAIRGVFSRSREPMAGLAIGDLNGEYERAEEWGYAVSRLMPKFPDFQNMPSWNPAEAFGETGCASVGLAIGVATAAFARQYANTDSILIWCSGEDRLKGALVLYRPN